MFYVYIIYSAQLDKYYIGQSENVLKRLDEHKIRNNLGASDWEIKYTEEYSTRSEAVKRESEIKKKKKRSYVEWLISSAG